MRLGQLARKLELRPTEIVEFLAKRNIIIEDGTNTKLDAAHVALAVQFFAPDSKVEDYPDTDYNAIDLTDDEASAQFHAGGITPALDESNHDTPRQESEVIKAPKIELSGLKVLGKIELPEAKKKPAEIPSEPADDAQNNKQLPMEKRKQFVRKQQRPAKNPIALQREQEALESKKKREEEIRLQKEKRTQNYLKKVKTQQPTKAARIIKEDAEEMSAAELVEPPKTLWGKFLRWLTT
jgi:hypothetical protein